MINNTRNFPLVHERHGRSPINPRVHSQSASQPNPQTSASQDPRDPGPRISVGRSRGLTHVSVCQAVVFPSSSRLVRSAPSAPIGLQLATNWLGFKLYVKNLCKDHVKAFQLQTDACCVPKYLPGVVTTNRYMDPTAGCDTACTNTGLRDDRCSAQTVPTYLKVLSDSMCLVSKFSPKCSRGGHNASARSVPAIDVGECR